MIVAKFGGSSLRDTDRIKHVADIIQSLLSQKPVIVFSAIGKTTDMLLDLAADALEGSFDVQPLVENHKRIAGELGVDHEQLQPLFTLLSDLLSGISLLREFSPKAKDYLLSFGERLSVRIITAYLEKELDVSAQYFDGWDAGIVTDSNYNEAEILEESYDRIRANIQAARDGGVELPVVTGFIARDKDDNITTFGRGGSDLTATLLGAALGAREIQVWKDVDGIMTTDPRLIPDARPVPIVSFEEASELAYFGAKVLHPLSLRPAMKRNIPVRIKNSYNPEHEGSVIIAERSVVLAARMGSPEGLVKAITLKEDVTLIDITSSLMLDQHGFLAKVFEAFERHQVSVDMVATSEVSVSLTINQNRRSEEGIQKVIEELVKFSRVSVHAGKAIVSLICEVQRSSEILAGAFEVLREKAIQIQMISQGASKVNIGLVVESSDASKALEALHQFFFPHAVAA